MSDIKTLRAYAEGRKLPAFKLLAVLPDPWIEYAYRVYSKTPISSDRAKEQRERDHILGTTVEGYDTLTEFYNQLYPNELNYHEAYDMLIGAHHFRFGELKVGHTVPMHLDEPFTLRGLCVIRGQHKFTVETGESVIMNPGELYFVNGCYKHSVENVSDIDRIALLNKFELNDHNVSILKNELL